MNIVESLLKFTSVSLTMTVLVLAPIFNVETGFVILV